VSMSKSTLLLLSLLALSSGTATAQETSAPDELVDRLGRMLARGSCLEVLEELQTARSDFPSDPDLATFEANCRLHRARTATRVFEINRYDRERVGRAGFPLDSEEMNAFYHTEMTYDESEKQQALELFRTAAEQNPSREDLHVGAIAAFVASGEFDTAITLLKNRKRPLSKPALSDLGRIAQDLIQADKIDRARELAAAMAEKYPDASAVKIVNALVAIEDGQLVQAVRYFSEASSQSKGNQALAARTAWLSLMSRQWQQAVDLLTPMTGEDLLFEAWFGISRERLVPGSTKNVWPALSEKLAQAGHPEPRLTVLCTQMQRVLSSSRPPTAEMRLRGARLFQKQGLFVGAIAEIDKALELDPDYVDAWLALAKIYRAESMYELALEAIDNSIRAAAKSENGSSSYSVGELSREKGRVLFALGRDEPALEALDAARKRGYDAPYVRGVIALQQGDKKEAVSHFQAALDQGGMESEWAKAKLEMLSIGQDG